ncbi:MAG: TatD family hydrolase [Chlorobiaceae bacterium]|nr:TatD family hydrolase [Chlorobiaceae bacterium]
MNTLALPCADIHCHLSFPEFDADRDHVIEQLRTAGIQRLIDPGTGVESSRRSIGLAGDHDFIYANVGLHPHEANAPLSPAVFDELAMLARSRKVIGIGEIGLDYHWPDHNPLLQQEVFRKMLRMAISLDLPVVIHCRDAWPDMLRILSEERCSVLRGAMHCFSGDLELARRCIALGLKISVPGTITWKKSMLPEVVSAVALEDLLSETDAPYLAPTPMRGKRNEPAFIVHTIRKIAGFRPEPPEKVADTLLHNAITLFDFP